MQSFHNIRCNNIFTSKVPFKCQLSDLPVLLASLYFQHEGSNTLLFHMTKLGQCFDSIEHFCSCFKNRIWTFKLGYMYLQGSINHVQSKSKWHLHSGLRRSVPSWTGGCLIQSLILPTHLLSLPLTKFDRVSGLLDLGVFLIKRVSSYSSKLEKLGRTTLSNSSKYQA